MTEITNRQRADILMRRLHTPGRVYPGDKVTASGIALRLHGQVGASYPVNAARVGAALTKFPNAKLEIEIDSPGGNLSEAEAIAERIMAHKGDTIATVKRACSSAAIHILLACDLRLCWTGAKFLVHRVAIEPERGERWTGDRHKKTASMLERFDRKLVDFYHKRTGRPQSEFQREIQTENPLSPVDACRLGLVHSYCHSPGFPIQNRTELGRTLQLGRRTFGRIGPIF